MIHLVCIGKHGGICNICGEQIYGKACVMRVIELNQQILKPIRGSGCCPINEMINREPSLRICVFCRSRSLVCLCQSELRCYLAPGVWTAVWKPEHIDRLCYRCLSCNQPNDITNNNIETCTNCRSTLHGRPAYW
jgi:hypothetical protein